MPDSKQDHDYPRESRRAALSGDYRHFGCVTRDALQFSLKTVGIMVTSAQLEGLVEGYDHLTLFPDAIRLLDALSGWRLSIFSNSSPAMLEALLCNAGIIDRFESVISVDEMRTYKPHPRTYRRIHPVSAAVLVSRLCALPFLSAANSTGVVRPGG